MLDTVKVTGIMEEIQPMLELACAYTVAAVVPFKVNVDPPPIGLAGLDDAYQLTVEVEKAFTASVATAADPQTTAPIAVIVGLITDT